MASNRKYLGWFWNLFLPVSLTAIMLMGAARIVLYRMPSFGGTTDWFSITIVSMAVFAFIVIRNMIDRSDEEMGYHRVCMTSEKWGRVIQNDPAIKADHIS